MTRFILALVFVLLLPGCVQPIDAPPPASATREHVLPFKCANGDRVVDVQLVVIGDEMASEMARFLAAPGRAAGRRLLRWISENEPDDLQGVIQLVNFVISNCTT
jgi:hypothetical protein